MSENTKAPVISIVMPAYNYAQFLPTGIESVLHQDFRDIELIVLNDDSADETDKVVAGYLADERVRYIKNEKNLGGVANANKGLDLARGEFVLLLAADDFLYPGALTRLHRALSESPASVLAYGRYAIADEFNNQTQIVNHPGHRYASYHGGRNEFAALLSFDCYVDMGVTLFRKAVLDAAGRFDLSLTVDGDGAFFRATDWDLVLRLAASGCEFSFVDGVLGAFRVHGKQLSTGENYWKGGRNVKEHLILLERFVQPPFHGLLRGHEQAVQALFQGKVNAYRQALPDDAAVVLAELSPRIESVRRGLEAVLFSEREPAAESPLVTVIVATQNRPRLLQDAIASLAKQTYSNWEAIVVNDGGPDIGAEVQAWDDLRRVRYIRLRQPGGPGVARNVALREARGEIVCYLDDDDLFLPNHLATVVKALSGQRNAFVYTDAELVEEEIKDGKRITGARGNPYRHDAYSHDRLLVSNYIPINTWAHHWDCLNQAGFFDETLASFEDWELLLKFSRHITFKHIPVTTVEVRRRPKARDSRTAQQAHNHLNVFCAIYQRTEDLISERIRDEREQALSELRQALEMEIANATGAAANPAGAGTIRAADSTNAANAARDQHYKKWLTKHTLETIDGQLFAERMTLAWKTKPVIHWVMYLSRHDQALLADTIDSLAVQLYDGWRLSVIADFPCPDPIFSESELLQWVELGNRDPLDVLNHTVETSQAEWVSLIRAGLRLVPHACLVFADYANLKNSWQLMYADEDRLDVSGARFDARFKPDFNLDLLRSTNYLDNLVVVKRSAYKTVGGFGVLFAESLDVAFKVYERFGDKTIGHVPEILASAPRDIATEPTAASRTALNEHLSRLKIETTVHEGFMPNTWRVQYQAPSEPFVSIVISTKDQLDLLSACLQSIFERTTYSNFEVVLVDNQSEDPDVHDYFEKLISRLPGRLSVVSHDAPFNFAAQANLASREAKGEYLLFLDNDTQVVQGDWLTRLMGYAQRSDVGVVGPRLALPETGRLQHAGYILGLDLVAGSPHQGEIDIKDGGYLGRALLDQNLSAVSGSCLLIKRTAFEKAGGMNETLGSFYADVDLCLKVGELGLRVVWTPHVTVVHHGSASLRDASRELAKQAEITKQTAEARGAMYQRWGAKIANDPAYHRHLTLVHRDCRVETDVVINWDVNFHDRPRVLGVPLTGGSGEYRVIQPLRALSNAGRLQHDCAIAPKMHLTRLLQVPEVLRAAPDTIAFHAALSDGELAGLAALRKHHKALHVFGLDDLITQVPEKSSVRKRVFRDARKRLRQALSYCDRAVVTTAPLAELCRGMIDEIRIIPNYLETARFGNLTSQRRQGRKPRVGWAGAQQHQGDLEILIDVVKATFNEVDWVFFGMCLDALRPYAKEVHEFRLGFDDYTQQLARLNLDLAVAPLELHPFNEAKSNLRILEYGALGWPVVCTDILPYMGTPAKRVTNDTAEWIKAIRERVHDLDATEKEGDALKAWVQAGWMLENHLTEWESAFTRPQHMRERLLAEKKRAVR